MTRETPKITAGYIATSWGGKLEKKIIKADTLAIQLPGGAWLNYTQDATGALSLSVMGDFEGLHLLQWEINKTYDRVMDQMNAEALAKKNI